MRTVYKYPEEDGRLRATVSDNYKIVLVERQDHAMCVWIESETDVPKKVIEFFIYGTGDSIVEGDVHVASFQESPFVWHVYRRK